MRAGFARNSITPPLGTRMLGWTQRDLDRGCQSIHDDLFVRGLYLEHDGREILILGFDVCFFDRSEVVRYKDRIGQAMGLAPEQILINTSHTHIGPCTARWSLARHLYPPDPAYLDQIENAAVQTAEAARRAAVDVTAWTGRTRCGLPINRRYIQDGRAYWRPYEAGEVYDEVPVCLFRDRAGRAVGLLFSVACHPSMVTGHAISSEFPGAAMARLDARLGGPVSLFLQGAGGDAKPRLTAVGEDHWRPGTWAEMDEAGEWVAREVLKCLETGLTPVEPAVRSALLEMQWPLMPRPGRDDLTRLSEDPAAEDLKRRWARDQLAILDRGEALASAAPIWAHGVQVARGVRIVGIEGELVAGLGHHIQKLYSDGVTFPLGYSNGAQLYLPTEAMLPQGGYEVDSYYEYGYPAPLAPGFEQILARTVRELQGLGIQ